MAAKNPYRMEEDDPSPTAVPMAELADEDTLPEPPAPEETFDISLGVVPQPEQTRGVTHLGKMEIYPDRIVVTGQPVQAAQTGAAVGGLLGALIGHAIAKRSKKIDLSLDPAQTRGFFDETRRALSLSLPDGQWLVLRPTRKVKRNFPLLLQALQARTGQGLEAAELGKMSPAQKRGIRVTLTIVGATVLAFVIFLILLAIN